MKAGRVNFRGAFYPVLLCGLLLAAKSAFASDDWQYWHDTEIKAELTEKYSLRLDAQQRLRDDFSDLYFYNFAGGFLWEASRFFEIGPFFRYDHEKDADGDHVNENRWLIEATLKHALGKLKLSDRSRIEYRNRNTTDAWRYRNRLKVSYPLPFKKIKITPFAADEIFWDITNHTLNQNRFSTGLETGLNRHVTLKTYYLLRSVRRGADWDEEHILGTGLSLKM